MFNSDRVELTVEKKQHKDLIWVKSSLHMNSILYTHVS